MIKFALVWMVVVGVVARDCIPRDFNQGGTVCVCNATYCDDTDPFSPSSISINEYIIFKSSKSGLRLDVTKKNFDQGVGDIGMYGLLINFKAD